MVPMQMRQQHKVKLIVVKAYCIQCIEARRPEVYGEANIWSLDDKAGIEPPA